MSLLLWLWSVYPAVSVYSTSRVICRNASWAFVCWLRQDSELMANYQWLLSPVAWWYVAPSNVCESKLLQRKNAININPATRPGERPDNPVNQSMPAVHERRLYPHTDDGFARHSLWRKPIDFPRVPDENGVSVCVCIGGGECIILFTNITDWI